MVYALSSYLTSEVSCDYAIRGDPLALFPMSSFKPLITDRTLASLSMVGGLLIFCVGVNLVWGQKVRVANMLPAILVAPILTFLPIAW